MVININCYYDNKINAHKNCSKCTLWECMQVDTCESRNHKPATLQCCCDNSWLNKYEVSLEKKKKNIIRFNLIYLVVWAEQYKRNCIHPVKCIYVYKELIC